MEKQSDNGKLGQFLHQIGKKAKPVKFMGRRFALQFYKAKKYYHFFQMWTTKTSSSGFIPPKSPGHHGGLTDWKKVVNWKVSEKIVYDEGSHTASLKEGTRFDANLKTIVVAHGNGGGNLDIQVWSIYGTLSSIIFIKFIQKPWRFYFFL